MRAWFESPAISSAAVPTAVTRPTRRVFDSRASSAPSASKSVSIPKTFPRLRNDYPLSTIAGLSPR